MRTTTWAADRKHTTKPPQPSSTNVINGCDRRRSGLCCRSEHIEFAYRLVPLRHREMWKKIWFGFSSRNSTPHGPGAGPAAAEAGVETASTRDGRSGHRPPRGARRASSPRSTSRSRGPGARGRSRARARARAGPSPAGPSRARESAGRPPAVARRGRRTGEFRSVRAAEGQLARRRCARPGLGSDDGRNRMPLFSSNRLQSPQQLLIA